MATGAPEFQGALVKLADALGNETRKVTGALARLAPEDARAVITDAYPEIASPYLAAAGDLSATWYEEQPTTSRAGRLFIAKPAELPTVEQLGANGRWALTQQDPGNALVGSSRRQTFNQSRETILNNTEAEGTRWIRHARSGACGFCRMLATRPLTEGHGGAPGLYRSEGSASRNTHRFETGHDFCRCIVIPLREGATYVAPDYLPQWLDDYYAVSRGPDGFLLPPQTIANRMEAIGRERGEYGDHMHGAGHVQPDVVNLDAPSARDAVAGVQRLTEKNAARAVEVAQPLTDRVQQAKHVAERVDSVVSTAATVTGRVKQVTDVADKLLGGTYPGVRALKTLVDQADVALGSASKVTGGAATVTRVADRTLRDTLGIAHGVKQIADEVGGVMDEAAAIALAARALVADTSKAIADVRGAGGLAERANLAVESATGIQADAAAILERARGTVEQVQAVVEGIGELPSKLRKPVHDMQSLAAHVRDVASDVQVAGADAGALAGAVRQLVDQLRDFRRTAAAEEAPRAPVKVASERLDTPAAIGLEPLDVEAFDLPEHQAALNRAPGPTAVDTGRQPLELEAAPAQLAIEAPKVPAPDAGAVADWLEAEQAHRDALEAWRKLDETPLPPAEAIADVAPPADAALDAIVTDDTLAAAVVEDQAVVEAGARTKGDELRDKLAEAQRLRAEPDDRRVSAAKKSQRKDARRLAEQKAQAELDAAIADGTADEVLAAPKPKRAKSRPLAEVEAERRAEHDVAMDQAVADFEAAVAGGDDAAITATADHMDALENAEAARREVVDAELAKIAAKHERQRGRREAAKRAEQDEIAAEVERLAAGEENISESVFQQAEATVVARRTGKDEQQVLEAIRKREFIRTAEVKGSGFEDTLKAVFRYEVHKAYQQAEEATRGSMINRANALKFDPVNLWYCNDATARKVMSEEMKAWFDENGRITLPVMRQMILDGDDNFARRTVMNADYLQ